MAKICPYCDKTKFKSLIADSAGTNIRLTYDAEHGWRLYTSIKDFVASNYSDEDVYHGCFSDTVKFCPMCSKELT